MNRQVAALLVLSAVVFIVGVALYSPRLAVIVTALLLFVAGASQLEVKGRSE